MKRFKFFLLLIFLIIPAVFDLCAQNFTRAGQLHIDPRQIIAENYTAINWNKSSGVQENPKLFNKNNPYTTLQLIADDKKSIYHILFQTSFTGELEYLACSNNLYPLFTRKDKPMHMFFQCMDELEREELSGAIREKAIDCILARLSYAGR